MSETIVLIAATPDVLSAFLQNQLEREYYIHCQFKAKSFPLRELIRNAKGIKFLQEDTDTQSGTNWL